MEAKAVHPGRIATWFHRPLLLSAGLFLAAILAAVGLFLSSRPRVPEVHGPLITLPLPEGTDFVGFSPNGKTILTAGSHYFGRRPGPLRLWDVRTGKERLKLAKDWRWIETVLFSPDCTMLAAHELEGDLKVWDARTGRELAAVRPATKAGNWVNFRFSPDGRLLAIQDYRRGFPNEDYTRLWDVRAQKDVGVIEGYVGTLAFFPDSRTATTFASGNGLEGVRCVRWNTAEGRTGEKLKELEVTADLVAISPDLASLASARRSAVPGGPTELALWDLASGTRRSTFNYDEGETRMQRLAFVAGGKVLWASGGGGTKLSWRTRDTLWDVTSTPRRIGTYSVGPTLSPDGKWVAVPKENGAELCMTADAEERRDLTYPGDTGISMFVSFEGMKPFPGVNFSPDSRLVAVTGLFAKRTTAGKGGSQVARLWDVETGQEVHLFSDCQRVVFSPDGKMLATQHHDGALRVWAVSTQGSE